MIEKRKIILHVDCSRAYDRRLLRGIARYSTEHGNWVFYRMPPFYAATTHKKYPFSLRDKLGAVGLITRNPEETAELVALGLPTIVTHDIVPIQSDLPRVVPDSIAFGTIGAEYFLNRGYRHFAFCGFDNMQWSRDTAKSFCERIAMNGFKCYLYQRPPSKPTLSWENEQTVIARWLNTLPKPLGLMCCNDDRGEQVIEACGIAGIMVPDEISVLGLDDDETVCHLTNPPLSSIVLNTERVGYEVARLLDKMMKGKEIIRQQIEVKPMYINVRQSTDVFAIENAEVVQAVKFIQKNARNIISVHDVVSHTACSRRYLELHFRRILGRSINEEIQRVRADEIARMLVETDLTVYQMASIYGYNHDHHIARFFRQVKGVNPVEYRNLYGRK